MKETPPFNASELKLLLHKTLELHLAEWKISQEDFMEKTKEVNHLDDDTLEKFYQTLIDLEKLSDPETPSQEKIKIQQKMG